MKTATVGISGSPYNQVPVKAYAGIPVAETQDDQYAVCPIRWNSKWHQASEKMLLTVLGNKTVSSLRRQLPNRQAIYQCSIGGDERDESPVLHDSAGLDDDQLLLLVCGYRFNENHATIKQLASVSAFEQSNASKLFGHRGRLLFFDSLWVVQPAQPLQLLFWTRPDQRVTIRRWVNWDGKTISIWTEPFWQKMNEESEHQDQITSFMTDPAHHFADFYLDLN